MIVKNDMELATEIFAYVMNQSALVVVVMNRQGIIERTNTYTAQLAGFEPVGKPFSDLIIDFQGTFEIDNVKKNGTDHHLLNITGKTGLPQTYFFHFRAVGNKVLAIGQQDTDEMEAMRRSMLAINSDLANMTRLLHKKNAQLEKLNAQKNQFFGMAVHDLRHPLEAIRMYSAFLADEAADRLDAKQLEFIDDIRRSGDALGKILDDFLDIAVFESGQLTLDRHDVDMVPWLANLTRCNKVLAAPQSIEIVFQAPSIPVTLSIDPSKMEQVVNNLLHNAVKYSSPGGQVSVALNLKKTAAVIGVRDSGPGIADSDRARVFKPFERLGTAGKPADKSPGLGLAIVKKIVNAHGGRVRVESRLGEGSTFFVTLPLPVQSSPKDGRRIEAGKREPHQL